MKRFYWPVAFVMIAFTALVGCSREPSPYGTPAGTPSTVTLSAVPTVSATLLAGRTMDVGTVTCWLNGNVLHVDYATRAAWMLSETHLVVAGSIEGIPVTRSGNAVPGRFPLNSTHDPCVPEFGYAVDLDAVGLADADQVVVAAHAGVKEFEGDLVVREEGAWARGEQAEPTLEGGRIERHGNRATYFTVNILKLRGLLLWNKLGSANEVANSRFGPDGAIQGQLEYMPCVYGNGFEPLPRAGNPNIPDNYIDFAGVSLRSQGCIEFWYHPSWNNWQVGHCVETLRFGLPSAPGAPVKRGMEIHYNDWQDLYYFELNDVVDGVHDGYNLASVYFHPSTIPAWTTATAFHIAFVWDGAAPSLSDRARVYINGARVGTTTVRGNPTLVWPGDFILRLGSRVEEGDWNRHPWEGPEGVIDNIKVWSFAKTDFSDRFEE